MISIDSVQKGFILCLHRRLGHTQKNYSLILSPAPLVATVYLHIWLSGPCNTSVRGGKGRVLEQRQERRGYSNQGWHIGGILPIPISLIWFSHNRYIGRYYRPISYHICLYTEQSTPCKTKYQTLRSYFEHIVFVVTHEHNVWYLVVQEDLVLESDNFAL